MDRRRGKMLSSWLVRGVCVGGSVQNTEPVVPHSGTAVLLQSGRVCACCCAAAAFYSVVKVLIK